MITGLNRGLSAWGAAPHRPPPPPPRGGGPPPPLRARGRAARPAPPAAPPPAARSGRRHDRAGVFQEMKPLDFRASMRSERPVEGTCWMYWVMPRLSISWKALASSSEM